MSNKFCPSCGSAIEPGTRFCPGCGTGQEAAPAAVAVKAEKPVNVKNTVLLGICGVLAATAIVLLCIIIFGGNGGGKGALTDYTYGDIVGTYTGEATVTSFKVSKDTEDYYCYIYGEDADYDGFIADEKETLRIGRSNDCALSLSRNGIDIRVGEHYSDLYYAFNDYFDLEDIGFTNGYCGETCVVEEFDFSSRKGVAKVECDLTLRTDTRYDYRIVGTLTVINDVDIYDGDGKHLYDITRTIVVEIDVVLSEQVIGQSSSNNGN